MSSPAVKLQQALRENPLLTKGELFAAANLYDCSENNAVFKFLLDQGTILKTGERRGTRYYHKDQNLEELLAQREAEQEQVAAEKEEAPKAQKLSEEESDQRLNEAKTFIQKYGKDGKLFSFDELNSDVDGAYPLHVLRQAIRDLLEEEELFETPNKRGKRYSFDESKIEEVEDSGRNAEIGETIAKIVPIFEQKKKGITTADLLSADPSLKKHIVYLALQELEQREKIERFGQGKSTSYSLSGHGEIEKVGSFTLEKVNAIKLRVYEFVCKKRVVRPLIIEAELDLDRRLLDTALDALVEAEKLKYNGERRAKIVAVLDADESEIVRAREEQVSLTTEVCDGLSAMVCNGLSFAAVQREGTITARRTPSYDPCNKTILHTSKSYGDFLKYMVELTHATNDELDEDARIEPHVTPADRG